MGGLTREEFKNLLEKASEPLRKSTDGVKKATVLYSYLNLTTLDFPRNVELAFPSPLFLFMSAFVLQLSC